MRTWTHVALLALAAGCLVLSFSACSAKNDPHVERIPTYHEDIAPILAAHCFGCHQEGAIGPFNLANYDDAKAHAESIRNATAARTMPPFILDNSGQCQTYVEARWLTDAQINALDQWFLAGSPEGNPTKGIVITPPPPTKLDRVDLSLVMSAAYTPDSTLFDDYRCFLVDPGLTEDTFITAFHVRPGEARMLHHLTLFAIDSEAAEQQAEALDVAEPGPGYACLDDLRIPDTRWLVGAGPGSGPLELPKGTGLRMKAGRKTLLQIHYNQENGLFEDRSQIDLTLSAQVNREASVRRVADTNLYLPPKQVSAEETADFVVPRPVTLWGLWPHMHKLGRSLRVTSIHDGQETCVALADRYDFHWQGFAHYTQPISVDRRDTLRITCAYDTMSRDGVTMWGQGTNDEMCIAFFYMTED